MESNREFLVACLCAQWCDTCVAYRAGFLKMAERFPRAAAEAIQDTIAKIFTS